MEKFLQNKSVFARSLKVGNGYTLVEILVVAGIISLFSAMLFRFYSQSNRSQTMLIEGLQMQTSVVTGVNKVLREIRHGSEFIVPGLSEPSSILVFKDFENNIMSIFPMLNQKLSEDEKEQIYDLFCYKTLTETINLSSPEHSPENLSLLCSNLKNIKFKLSNANSVTITFDFQRSGKIVQSITEAALMNSGDPQ